MNIINDKSSLFEILDKLDSAELAQYKFDNDDINKNLYNNLFMIYKYTFGCSSPNNILLFDQYINKYIFSLGSKHNELIVKLLNSVSRLDNSRKKYKWQYPKKTKK